MSYMASSCWTWMIVEGTLSLNFLQCGLRRTWEVTGPRSASLAKLQNPKNYVEMLWNLTYFEPESLLRGNVAGEWYAWRCECFLVPSAVWYCLRFGALCVGSRWSMYDFCECLICGRTYIMPCLPFTGIEWLLRSLVYQLAAMWASSDMGFTIPSSTLGAKPRKCCEFDLFWAGRVAQA